MGNHGDSWMTAERTYFTSESVTEGHPDKVCDQISDAVLDAVLAAIPKRHVACETATTTGMILVFGEISTTPTSTFRRSSGTRSSKIGYTHSSHGFDANTCGVMVAIKDQSPEISAGVAHVARGSLRRADVIRFDLSRRRRPGHDDRLRLQRDAGIDATADLARARLCPAARRGAQERRDCPGCFRMASPRLPSSITAANRSASTPWSFQRNICRMFRTKRFERTITRVGHPASRPGATCSTKRRRFLINPSGRFEIGGPMADAGLTGRKIIVDTYGGMARHGGGAFSGKDATKVDRSAAYAARYVAKNVVAAGLADRFEVQVSYAIGKARPVSIHDRDLWHRPVPDEQILQTYRGALRPAPGGDHRVDVI